MQAVADSEAAHTQHVERECYGHCVLINSFFRFFIETVRLASEYQVMHAPPASPSYYGAIFVTVHAPAGSRVGAGWPARWAATASRR